jgi:hypothetical protein
MTSTRLLVAAGLVALLAVAGLFLSEKAQRLSGTDLTPNNAFIKTLTPGSQLCQDQELLPADTSALEMTMGTYGHPGPSLAVRFTGPSGRTLTTGNLKAGWTQGVVQIPVAHVSQPTAGTTFCMRDEGPGLVVLAGYGADLGYSLRLNGRTYENQRLRIDYLRPGRESWLALIPTIIHRFSLAKADLFRIWAWVAVLISMLVAVSLAVVLILKQDA